MDQNMNERNAFQTEVIAKDISRAMIVYFSGTGGTVRVAGQFESALRNRGIDVFIQPLDYNSDFKESFEKVSGSEIDILLLIYAVHAFDAPEPVYEWIEQAKRGNSILTAVISVSAGGEVWPNTACRFSCINTLKRRGFNVIYEKMFVMPSNWMYATEKNLAVRLLKVLPLKAEHAVGEILSGQKQVTAVPEFSARAVSFVCRLEKPFARLYAKDLKVSGDCSGCGWCAESCPRKNIRLKDGKPVFGWECVMCLRCVYGCPENALKSRILKFITIKEGFSIAELEKQVQETEPDGHSGDTSKADKNGMFEGVLTYLSEGTK